MLETLLTGLAEFYTHRALAEEKLGSIKKGG